MNTMLEVTIIFVGVGGLYSYILYHTARLIEHYYHVRYSDFKTGRALYPDENKEFNRNH